MNIRKEMIGKINRFGKMNREVKRSKLMVRHPQIMGETRKKSKVVNIKEIFSNMHHIRIEEAINKKNLMKYEMIDILLKSN
jgi:uncharacterized protein Veg